MKESQYCVIKIKQETIPWNWNQNNPTLRKQRQDELAVKYHTDYYTIINAVVNCGGVVCMDKHSLDNEWRMMQPNIRIKIPIEAIEKFKAMPQLESFTVDTRTI
jgi:hypothetical protein